METNIQKEKDQLQAELSQFMGRAYIQQKPRLLAKAKELKQDIQNDFYTVVVLGEFKRGKSTFVNALLGKSLLPMNILPETATINAIMYCDTPTVQVVYKDGTWKQGEAAAAYLEQFSARQEVNRADDVRYIKIGYPSSLLKNRVVLVDTPGVSDLDEQRCDITYEFLPKANAVLFLLDANAPLKKTEKDFIEERLLPQGIHPIMFLLNKYDAVDDEEEEDSDLLENTRKRLSTAFKRDIPVYPVSARWALDGLEQKNESLVEASQIYNVRAQLEKMLTNGEMTAAKYDGWKHRWKTLVLGALKEITADEELCKMSKESIQQILNDLDVMSKERQQNKKNIGLYVDKRKEEINIMIAKSLQYFHGQLKEDLLDRIDDYQGADFKEFMENKITRRIQRQMEAWAGMYTPHINNLLKKLEQELSHGLSYYFQQSIQIETEAGHEVRNRKTQIHITAEDISQVNIEAGMIAAVSGIGLMAVVGGAVMPIIGFAAAPFLRSYMLKKKLAEAKTAAIPELSAQLARAMQQLQIEVSKYVEERVTAIQQNTEYAYEQILLDMRKQFQQQMDNHQDSKEQIEQKINLLKEEEIVMRTMYEKFV